MNLVEEIRNRLKENVYDPELNINVVDLGLIYNIEVSGENDVTITMTLTTPGCPLHSSIERGVRSCLHDMKTIGKLDVNLVWQPAWTPERMSEDAKKLLGF